MTIPIVWVSLISLVAAPSSAQQQETDVEFKRENNEEKSFCVRILLKIEDAIGHAFSDKELLDCLPGAVLTTRKEDFDHPIALCAVNSI
jgi:hypothetical protein